MKKMTITMPTFLYTVTSCEDLGDRFRLEPGIPLGEGPPEFGEIKPGDPLELRFPDGTVRQTSLLTFGVSAQRSENGETIVSFPMMICLSIPREGFDEVPEGTEIWM